MLRELNNEAILLMYLADELPAADRAEVERMLQGDPALRAELAHLESAVDSFEAGMAVLDSQPLTPDDAAVRRIGAAMRQHVIETSEIVAAPRTADPAVTLRYPWWTYPAIGAAAVIVLMVSWWGSRPIGPLKIAPKDDTVVKIHSNDPANSFASTGVTSDEPDAVESVNNPNPTIAPTTVASLDDLQNRVEEISHYQPIPIAGDGNE